MHCSLTCAGTDELRGVTSMVPRYSPNTGELGSALHQPPSACWCKPSEASYEHFRNDGTASRWRDAHIARVRRRIGADTLTPHLSAGG
jgi:hypothetical protein